MSITSREKIAARFAAAFLVFLYGPEIEAELARGAVQLFVRLAGSPAETVPVPLPRPIL